MKYQVIRSRKQIEATSVHGVETASAAIAYAEANENSFRSILDSHGEWSYEVRPER